MELVAFKRPFQEGEDTHLQLRDSTNSNHHWQDNQLFPLERLLQSNPKAFRILTSSAI